MYGDFDIMQRHLRNIIGNAWGVTNTQLAQARKKRPLRNNIYRNHEYFHCFLTPISLQSIDMVGTVARDPFIWMIPRPRGGTQFSILINF